MTRIGPRAAASLVLLLAAFAAARSQTITVTLLGTGSPMLSAERFGPSTLVEAGGEKLLIDCGRGVPIRLAQLQIPERDITAVLFTHLHSDHVVGFPDLWLTGWLPSPFGQRVTAMHVFGPTGTGAMMTALRDAYAADIRIRAVDERLPVDGIAVVAIDIEEGWRYEKNGVVVTAFNVDHGPLIKPSLGYRVDYAGHSVVISGDTRVSENLIRFSAGVDLLVHEVAYARPELLASSEAARLIIGHHTTPEDAGRVFSRVKPRLAVYTHIVLLTTDASIRSPTIEELIAATRTTYSGPLVAGEDLTRIEVGAGPTPTVTRWKPPAS
jgi:ribonuclease Z